MYTTTPVGTNCIAQITKRKNRLKVYKSSERDQIFLQDNDEFEIELFNPKQNSVLAKISINGNLISGSGIILRPGQRVFLERFLDSKEKFRFSTYEVSDSKQSKDAIEKNGTIRVEFYDEYVPSYTYYTNPCNISTGGTTVNNTFTLSSLNLTGSASSLYSSASNCNTDIAGSLNLNSGTASYVSDSSGIVMENSSKSIETGRVEKGSKSNQEFTYTNGNFNFFYAHVVEYKILPNSQKPIEISEIRNYCTQCGVRNKSNWKFCPSCGNRF